MNIWYLVNHLEIGGISSYIFNLARGMINRGHRVWVISSGGRLSSRFEAEGIGNIIVPIKTKSELSPKLLASWWKLLPCLKKLQVDILHANTRVTQVLSSWLCAQSGLPYLSTCHGFFKKSLHRRLFPCWGRRVIAISQQVKMHLLQDFSLREDEVILIPHGVEIKEKNMPERREDNYRLRAKLGLKIDGPVIGIVARLSEIKGHIYLIEAMKYVLPIFPQAQLLIVGEGKLKGFLHNVVTRFELLENTVFISDFELTQDCLAAMDIFVMPSLNEGLGLGVMEAMAQGLPVVASRVGGLLTLIQDGVNGILVEPRDSKALAKAILYLLSQPEKRHTLADKAREFIISNFPLEVMVKKTEQVYESLVG